MNRKLPWLRLNLKAESGPKTGIILVSFEDGSPKEQVQVINSVVDALTKHLSDSKRSRDQLKPH